MIIPYHVDVPMARVPVANFAIIGVTCVAHFVFLANDVEITGRLASEPWVLWGGHLLIHGDFFHLIGNMIFLWVFGNAVCAKVGNAVYPAVYYALGIAAALTHMLIDGRPGIGASGAINGIVGMFLVWYALNEISCFCLFGVYFGTIAVSSFWMILLWFAFDILGAAMGGDMIGYWAHLGGFGAGIIMAALLMSLGAVQMEPDERSLFDILAGNDPKRKDKESPAPGQRRVRRRSL